jgi:hypothetical protein
MICRDNLHIIINNSDYNIQFFLALINSKLLNFIYEVMNPEKGEALAQVKKSHVEQLPIPVLDLSNKTDKAKHNRIVSLADRMLELKKLEAAERNTDRKALIAKQISGINRAIDSVVYELYGLSEGEVRVVEWEGEK